MAATDFQYFLYQTETVFGGGAKVRKAVTTKFTKYSSHTSYSAMLHALHKKQEEGVKGLSTVIVPKRIFVGMKLWDSEGNYYGEIVKKDRGFYLIKKPLKGKEDVPCSWKEEVNIKLTKGGKVSLAHSSKQRIDIEPTEREIAEWLEYANSCTPIHESAIKDFFINGCLGNPGFRIREEDVEGMKFPEIKAVQGTGKPFVGKYRRIVPVANEEPSSKETVSS